MIDVRRDWVYDHNSFVQRGVETDQVVDLWRIPLGEPGFPSLAGRICEGFGLAKTFLRHARLYAFEDVAIDRDAVVVHVTGKSAAASSMPDRVIERIRESYSGYTIYQIGGADDKETPFLDRRGLPIWDSIRLIASSAIFIGVDSGPMNIANCYPRVRKKVVILRKMDSCIPVAHPIRWIDYNWEYYNVSDDDNGISMSYLKI